MRLIAGVALVATLAACSSGVKLDNVPVEDRTGSAAGAAGAAGAAINGLTGAVSAITAGGVATPFADTGPANPATDAPASVASAVTIVSTTGSSINADCAAGVAGVAGAENKLLLEEELDEELVGPDIADVKEETVVVVDVVVVLLITYGFDSDPSGISGLLTFGLPFPSDGPLSLTQITPSLPSST